MSRYRERSEEDSFKCIAIGVFLLAATIFAMAAVRLVGSSQ